MNKMLALSTLAAAFLFAGCASTIQHVPMPDQSKRLQDESKGRIYVMRPAAMGSAISMHVADGGNPIGRTGPKGYLCWERDPGDVVVSSQSENTSRVALPVRAGSTHYLIQHVRMGMWVARTDLELVDEAKGQETLKKCKPGKQELQK